MSQQTQTRTMKGGVFHRTFTVNRSEIDKEKRTVPLAFSSESPVERWYGYEILDHKAGSADLSRLTNSAPLLVNHHADDQVGVVEAASIDTDRKGRAVVRFGRSQRAEEIFQDVLDGIRSLVSVGYRVYELATEKVENGVETLRAVKWTPLEISIVGIPADASVGVGRAEPQEENTITVVTRNMNTQPTPAAEPTTPPAPGVAVTGQDPGAWRKQEALRAQEIRAIAKRTGNGKLVELAESAVENGTSVDEFRRAAFETAYPSAKPIETPAPEIGMSRKELKRYSLVRALNRLALGKPLDGLEREASDAVSKRIGKDPEGFFVPFDVQAEHRQYPVFDKRELNAGTFTAGGALVSTDLYAGNLIELLRNRMVITNLGATTLSGLQGNVAIPRQSGGATAYWLTETATVSTSQQTVGQLALTPHRLAARTAYSKTLLVQSSLDVENFVRSDLFSVLAIEKDRAALAGTGAAGEPLGILNTAGLSTGVTFSNAAAPTWAEIVSFETNVANSNADFGRLGYAMTPTARGKLKTTAKAANQAIFIWEKDAQGRPGFGEVNSYPAIASLQVPAATNVIFGNWSDLIVADWADGMDVVVDPYSLSAQGQVQVVVTHVTDSGIRHAASFCVSTNGIT